MNEAKPLQQIAFENRTVYVMHEINAELLASISLQLFALDLQSNKPIHLYICSPGGSVTDGLAIIDIMQTISSPIYTYAYGSVASMAAVIFAFGQKRYILPNAQIMLHQPMGGVQGQASDIQIAANRIQQVKEKINNMIALRCSKPMHEVEKDTDRDIYLDAKGAIEYGIADFIVESKQIAS